MPLEIITVFYLCLFHQLLVSFMFEACLGLEEVGIVLQCCLWWQRHKPWRVHCMIGCWQDHLQAQTPVYHHWMPLDAIWVLSFCYFQLVLLEKVLEYSFLVLLLYYFQFLFHGCHTVIVENGIHNYAICFHWPCNDVMEPFNLSFSFLSSTFELFHTVVWWLTTVYWWTCSLIFHSSTPTAKDENGNSWKSTFHSAQALYMKLYALFSPFSHPQEVFLRVSRT